MLTLHVSGSVAFSVVYSYISCSAGLRQVNCALTDLYLANPHIFHVVDVLRPVCLDIWRGIQAKLSSIASEFACYRRPSGHTMHACPLTATWLSVP